MNRTERWKRVLGRAALMLVCSVSLTGVAQAQSVRPGRALSNADIVGMVKGGKSDSEVIRAIRSRQANFDLSGERLLEMHKQGVSAAVLQAMLASGKGTGPSQQGLPLGKAPLAPEKAIRMTSKPGAMNAHAAILAVLQKQRNAADAEVARTRLGMRRPGPARLLGSPPQPMPAGLGKPALLGHGSRPAAADTRKKSAAANQAILAPKVTMERTPTAAPMGPERTSSAMVDASARGGLLTEGGRPAATQNDPASSGGKGMPGGSGSPEPHGNISSRMTALPALVEGTALACAQDPTFRILKVSGSYTPATFTPIDAYNLYTIEGCGFGNQAPTGSQGPTNWVRLYGPGTFNARFVIKFWSDNEIEVSLDPSLSGYLDLDNLTLVVKRGDGQQTQKGGFKFYAARQSVLLRSIPSSWVKHPAMWNGADAFTASYFSPASSYPPLASSSATAYVSRYFDGAKFDPTGFYDSYDLGHLAPGWTADAQNPPQLIPYAPNCPGAPLTITYKKSFGMWTAEWDGNNVRVSLEDTSCSGVVVYEPWFYYKDRTSSYYALKVWVVGPRGTDPMTGHATK